MKAKKDDKYLYSPFFEIVKIFHTTKKAVYDEKGLLYSAKNSIAKIFEYYKIPYDIDNLSIKNKIDDLDAIINHTGLYKRDIVLKENWWKDCHDAILGWKNDNQVIALLPTYKGYRYYDYEQSKYVIINRETAKSIQNKGIMFYRLLDKDIQDRKGLYKYILSLTNIHDIVIIIVASILTAIIALFFPVLNKLLFSMAIYTYQNALLYSVLFIYASLIFITNIINYIKIFIQHKVIDNVSHSFDAAIMAKLTELPTSFFSEHNSTETNTMINKLSEIPRLLINGYFSSIISIICILIFIPQIIVYAPSMILPSLVIFLIQVLISIYAIKKEREIFKRQINNEKKLYSINYNLLSGLHKIKYCGAEKRALSKWLGELKNKINLDQNPPFIIRHFDTIIKFINIAGYASLYYFGYKVNISAPNFIAFSLTFSLIASMANSIIGSIESIANIFPIIYNAKPFITAGSTYENKIYVLKIQGKIEFNNVSFTYPGQTNKILDNISFTIEEGEYIAIAGKTGIGKSTIFRLLLGFEKPQSGAIYIDGKDITNINLISLRKHFGTVLQNSKLLPGDIISNIRISKQTATEEQVWDVCKIANLDNDIKMMPFALNTNVGEKGGNLSKGQIQRIMIARALLSEPSILLFDEAMTALDYESQKKISKTIENLPCTRIIVSHRLSTIRQCNKILVLDQGKIVASGTFDDLEKNSPEFQKLISKKDNSISLKIEQPHSVDT